MLNSYLEFYGKTAAIKKQVGSDPTLTGKIKAILHEERWDKITSTGFYASVDDEICLKKKLGKKGAAECAITVDLFNADFPMADFLVILEEYVGGKQGVTYLTRNFGNVKSLHSQDYLTRKDMELFEDFWMGMIMKGYQINQNNLVGCAGMSKDGLVFFDLDPSTFDEITWSGIFNGLYHREGGYQRLNDIYRHLTLDEIRLDLTKTL